MRNRNILYWIATLWLSLGMVATGIAQLLKVKDGPGAAAGMAQLGYPSYLLTLLGAWKLLGVIALLVPGYRLLKEWAYAGFFFLLSGAIVSHLAAGDPISSTAPAALLVVLTLLSWYYRPASRKLGYA